MHFDWSTQGMVIKESWSGLEWKLELSVQCDWNEELRNRCSVLCSGPEVIIYNVMYYFRNHECCLPEDTIVLAFQRDHGIWRILAPAAAKSGWISMHGRNPGTFFSRSTDKQ